MKKNVKKVYLIIPRKNHKEDGIYVGETYQAISYASFGDNAYVDRFLAQAFRNHAVVEAEINLNHPGVTYAMTRCNDKTNYYKMTFESKASVDQQDFISDLSVVNKQQFEAAPIKYKRAGIALMTIAAVLLVSSLVLIPVLPVVAVVSLAMITLFPAALGLSVFQHGKTMEMTRSGYVTPQEENPVIEPLYKSVKSEVSPVKVTKQLQNATTSKVESSVQNLSSRDVTPVNKNVENSSVGRFKLTQGQSKSQYVDFLEHVAEDPTYFNQINFLGNRS